MVRVISILRHGLDVGDRIEMSGLRGPMGRWRVVSRESATVIIVRRTFRTWLRDAWAAFKRWCLR